MSIPPRLANKLHETLGAAASGDLVNWLDEMRTDREAMRADFAELRQEMLAMEARLVERITTSTHSLETRLGERIHAGEVDLGRRIGEVGKEVEKSRGVLVLWSFVFWVGAVTSIAFLARALRP